VTCDRPVVFSSTPVASDEPHDQTEVVNSVKNIRKLLQDYEKYVFVYNIEKRGKG
jgi:DNA-binding winged helix-turn-helix (wHTH) protein